MTSKLNYTMIGCIFSLANIYLIPTRFNIVGLGFGIVGAIFLIQAIRIKK
jgi:hypothetical protein